MKTYSFTRIFILLLIICVILLMTTLASAQSDHSKSSEGTETMASSESEIYRQWWEANARKDSPDAMALAKKYIEQFPNGVYNTLFQKWLEFMKPVSLSPELQQEMINLSCQIIRNFILDSDKNYASRRILVKIDEDVFSEPILRQLFEVLSKHYSEPSRLTIHVITVEEQMPTGISEKPGPPGYYEHHRAVYLRLDGNELFRYSVKPTDRDLKTIVLKGVDPHER